MATPQPILPDIPLTFQEIDPDKGKTNLGTELARLGDAIGDGRKKQIINRATKELNQTEEDYQKSVEELLAEEPGAVPTAVNDVIGAVSGVNSTEHFLEQPIPVQNLLREFAQAKRTNAQSSLYIPSSALALKKEMIVRKYMTNYPGFQGELAKAVAASSGLGRDVSLASEALDEYQRDLLGLDTNGNKLPGEDSEFERLVASGEKKDIFRNTYDTDLEYIQDLQSHHRLSNAAKAATDDGTIFNNDQRKLTTAFRGHMAQNQADYVNKLSSMFRFEMSLAGITNRDALAVTIGNQNLDQLQANMVVKYNQFKAETNQSFQTGILDPKVLEDLWAPVDSTFEALSGSIGTGKFTERLKAFQQISESDAMFSIPGGPGQLLLLDAMGKLIASDPGIAEQNRAKNSALLQGVADSMLLAMGKGTATAAPNVNENGVFKEDPTSSISRAKTKGMSVDARNAVLTKNIQAYSDFLTNEVEPEQGQQAAVLGAYSELVGIAGMISAQNKEPKPSGQVIDIVMPLLSNPDFVRALDTATPTNREALMNNFRKVSDYAFRLNARQAKEEILKANVPLSFPVPERGRELEIDTETGQPKLAPTKKGEPLTKFIKIELRGNQLVFQPRDNIATPRELLVLVNDLNRKYGLRMQNVLKARANLEFQGNMLSAFEDSRNSALANASDALPMELFD